MDRGLRTSELIVGGCRLEAVVGRGGMGTVYRATQLALGRVVAVKVVPAEGADAALVDRFKREARTAAGLEHPHLVPIYAAGEEDGLLYLVMRLVAGVDLGALVKRDGPLAADRAVSVVEEVAGALDAIHAAGLVHRDVKPANILIERPGNGERAYLSDFGLMRSVVERSAITKTGERVGTIDYAAPEQLQGGAVGPSADIYALGAVLCTMLTGKPPFPRGTVGETARAHATSPPPRVERPATLNPVIARAMAKSPPERFKTAGALAGAARRAIDRPGRRGPRRRLFAAATALALIAAIAAGVVLASSGGGTETKTPTAPNNPQSTTGRTASFTFAYPYGWHMAKDEAPMGAFDRTQVVSAGGSQLVIIDHTPSETLGLSTWSAGVEHDTGTTLGYQLVSSTLATIKARPAVIWEFSIGTGPKPARVDVFRRIGADGYAVLGEGVSFSSIAPIALSVARSLRPRS